MTARAKQLIGKAMIAALFIALIAWAVSTIGVRGSLIVFGSTAALMAWVAVGVSLAMAEGQRK